MNAVLVDSNILLDVATADPVWADRSDAHAAVAGYRLLTRDASRYRTYFPRLDVVGP